MKEKSCCFIGHRTIKKESVIRARLKIVVDTLLKEGVKMFYFGSKSAFDDMALKIVSELKNQYNDIVRVYVRSSYLFIDDYYKDYLLKYYEHTFMPDNIENAGKYSYVERNYKMIDACDICIFYYNEEYKPPKRHHSHSAVSSHQPKSGTMLAYEYAKRKKKEIINLYSGL